MLRVQISTYIYIYINTLHTEINNEETIQLYRCHITGVKKYIVYRIERRGEEGLTSVVCIAIRDVDRNRRSRFV